MWEQIRANHRRSAILVTVMAAILVVLGFAGGYALGGADAAVLGIGIALLIWGLQMAVYATSADSILLQGTYAKELQRFVRVGMSRPADPPPTGGRLRCSRETGSVKRCI